MSLGSEIKNRKKELKISNAKICEQAGISQRMLLYTQSDTHLPCRKVLDRLCEVLNLEWEIVVRKIN